jgi:hypothetical protein
MGLVIFFAVYAALGLLFGSMLFTTALAVILTLAGRRGAITAATLAISTDLILLIIFFVWPFSLTFGLRFLYADLTFFGCMALAVLVLSSSSLIGGESAIEVDAIRT